MKKKRTIPIVLLICILLSLNIPAAMALDDPNLGAQAVLIADMDSGRILYSKNADAARAPASLTKIMTVLVAVEAVERGDVQLSDIVTAGNDCREGLGEDSSTSGIVPGEKMSLENLLYCAMVHSANESCNVVASYIAGSVSEFVELMNIRANELGCTNTHFVNTNGLPAENHYTTARDLFIITRAALKHDLFYSLCNTITYTVPATNMSGERILANSNALICADGIYGPNYLYKYASGVKTGYTRAAGYCLVSTAAKDGVRVMSIVLGCDGVLNSNSSEYTNFLDARKSFEWVFNNFEYRELLSTGDNIVEVTVDLADNDGLLWLRPQNGMERLMPKDTEITDIRQNVVYTIYDEKLVAPLSAGTVLGEMKVVIDGEEYGTTKLVASKSIELSKREYLRMRLVTILDSKLVKAVIIILVLLLVLYIALVTRYRYLRKKHLKEKRQAEKRRRAEMERRRQEREARIKEYEEPEE